MNESQIALTQSFIGFVCVYFLNPKRLDRILTQWRLRKFYICHRYGIFQHQQYAPEFSRYGATADLIIRMDCGNITNRAICYAKFNLPTNKQLELKRRTFGGVDRTWSNREYNLMVAKATENNHNDYVAILTLARYAGLRLEECFRIDTNDAENTINKVYYS